ncbi:gamma-glutamyltransferase [Granulicella mallensis]|uniref:Glutathione hydrolase proenzyme n=1 Tax=Granulicella mallensis (strain ATCC BAA-1857 / DSM 23137 / MP5ACTX8) TaxID=682795 RepID=G8NXR6_GRAMM|nr:gamma-glutamyltransferase [Granulicella mallensis]AEU34411.1 gamma-glutamyltransferase [Granulicella mallensis MP5ACTX8]
MARFARISSVALSCTLLASSFAVAQTPPVTAPHAMVVTIHHDATDAGVEILREGGNAIDAAVAVGFALAVVHPAAGNIGGGGFMLIRPGTKALAHGQPHFLDYREKAPAAAGTNMYLDAQGNVIPKMSTVGSKASGVPGTVAGLTYAEKQYGRLGLARVMQPAIKLARDGYVLTEEEAHTLHSGVLSQFPASYRIFQRNGRFYEAGERFRQPELAHTLERIATDPEDFYRGKMAAEIADFEKANNGLITAQDLAMYQVKERTPLVGHYHGYEVLTSPPPSSGGIVLLETLNILSGYDLPKVGPDRSPAQIHLITEAFRRAYMDRGDYLGDPDFNTMPLAQMADPKYAEAWRKTIDPTKPSPSATLVRPAGFMPEPPQPEAQPHESPQTTHFSVVDADGNAVSSTYTLNFGFGSGVTVDGLGFLLNDEMDDFASKMGVPNGFGLIQGPANAIAPGKRPLSSMTPTIVSEPSSYTYHKLLGHTTSSVVRPGKLRLVLGSPGGSTIITTVANDLISVLDNGLDVQAGADAPRFHHQYLPDVLQFEKTFPQAPIAAMKAAGYVTKREAEFDEKSAGQWGDSELIAVDPKTGVLMGGQDKRHHFGKAAGY